MTLALGGAIFLSAASAEPPQTALQRDDAIAAFRAGDYENAWRMLQPVAAAGDVKAQRYLGHLLVSNKLPGAAKNSTASGVALLKTAALAGDYVSLIKLENMRRADEHHAPSVEDIVLIEKALAENGDPVTAWRLANRYESGEGVVRSRDLAEKWLVVVASGRAEKFPKTREAAFRLCEMNAVETGGEGVQKAKKWCAQAAEYGHAGAAIMLRRIARAAG